MVDEKDEGYESQEEGEYHFSDDQVNYDVEGGATPKAQTPAAPMPATGKSASAKEVALKKLSEHRRVVIGVVVFIVLIGVVYKMLAPVGTTPPSTEFAATKPMTAAPPKVQKPAAAQVAAATTPEPTTQAPAPETAAANPPPAGTAPQVQAAPGMMPPPPPGQGAAPTNLAQVAAAPAQGIPTIQPMGAQTTMTPPASAQPVAVQVTSGPQPVAPPSDEATKNIMDRLTSLEQQNAALMNLLQTEYAQKMADYETQLTMTRGKLEEITKRLNRIDTTLSQLNQGGPQSVVQEVAAPTTVMKVLEPKMVYTVQAIIPGRAWLKSESGETVTVAEGDVLRNYGRVTKIDPYDGVVNIDTGNKIITLSYGTNLE